MSVVIDGKIATLSNYLELSKGYSADIQDEIRSAILDDTPISPYLKRCKDDSFRLNQIRLCIREYIPSRYISTHLSATNLKWIRQIHKKGYSLSVLDCYLSKRGVLSISCDALDLLLSAYYDGVDISKVDFNIVPEDLVGIVCAGLKKGYPMWVFSEKFSTLSKEHLRVLIQGMNLNLDIHPFLDDNWDVDSIRLILSNATRIEYTVLMKHINSRFSKVQLDEVLSIAIRYLDFIPLCLKDEDGYPIFNEFQMGVLGEIIVYNAEAEKLGKSTVDIDSFLSPSLSDLDMRQRFSDIVDSFRKEERRVLGGRLPRKN